MREGDNLKSYIGYFQSQLAKVSHYSKNVSSIAFISGLQISHPLYKYLLKYDVTRMSEILSQAQCYIQLEKTMKSSANHPAKRGDVGEKSKSRYESITGVKNPNRR